VDDSGIVGDPGWEPMPVPPGFEDKLTVTLEVAVSELQVKLERSLSDGGYIELKADSTKPRVTIDILCSGE
jgi:hypothetical protein